MTCGLAPNESNYGREYDSKERFISYWHQIDETTRIRPSEVLEIGIGNGFVSNYLAKLGVSVTTCDLLRDLKPDVCGSVLKLPYQCGAFEAVICYEVLEHIEYVHFVRALREMGRVSREWCIISIPDSSLSVGITIRVPRFGHASRCITIPEIPGQNLRNGGEHRWEIGLKSYPLRRILKDIESTGFAVQKSYRVPENPYHRFFVLRHRRLFKS